jgi:hypothetical protein
MLAPGAVGPRIDTRRPPSWPVKDGRGRGRGVGATSTRRHDDRSQVSIGVQNDRRHVIASAHSTCPSKPSSEARDYPARAAHNVEWVCPRYPNCGQDAATFETSPSHSCPVQPAVPRPSNCRPGSAADRACKPYLSANSQSETSENRSIFVRASADRHIPRHQRRHARQRCGRASRTTATRRSSTPMRGRIAISTN